MISEEQIKKYPRPIARRPRDIIRLAYPCRPTNRSQCINGPRPCVFVSCRYNLFLDVMESRVRLYKTDPVEMPETCALDLAEKYRGMALEEIAVYLNLTRERVRQIIVNALRKIMRPRFR